MTIKFIYRVLILLCVLTLGCKNNNEVHSLEDFVKWLNNQENGLCITKYINGLEIKVKYLPSVYLSYKDLSDKKMINKHEVDSLMEYYNKSMTFLMTIGPDEREEKGSDVMFKGVKDYKEYKKRICDLNFEIENYVSINTKENTYKPVLMNLENIYGLENSRSMTFVFAPIEKGQTDIYTSEDIDFIFNDDFLGTGTNHFLFKRKDVNNIPEFIFWNKE